MKKQFLCLLLVLSAILAVSAYAASDRTIVSVNSNSV